MYFSKNHFNIGGAEDLTVVTMFWDVALCSTAKFTSIPPKCEPLLGYTLIHPRRQ
jgi:hypothetical protein